MSIPTIDLSLADSPSTRPQLVATLRKALLEVGFLYITNHGIQPSLIEDLVAALPTLFSLPIEAKLTAALLNSPHFLGYSRFGSETTASKADEREQFEFANELPDLFAQGAQPLYTCLQGPNQYPSHPSVAQLASLVQRYIVALQTLAARFLDLAALALDLAPSTLQPFTGPQDRLKLVHYRPSPTVTDELSQGVGPHKDSSGWLTFLLQASPGTRGLQVLDKSGAWLDVPPLEGSLVVNMGQAFEVATNGVCKATTHRVLLPPGDYNRYSVPFFQGVRPELTKEAFKALWTHFDPEKWETAESVEGSRIDSPFLRGGYVTWGDAQLRTKIRSHRDVGKRWYGEIFDKYVNDA
ncbi:uncharacterized protein HMPREF1541_01603 [Cyphellophora europaea CBS 101466]|uniref:Fe2OG dioxygenase domain-containing protein n=1 Tax=Cyphellophora europaea (strain CBS 101466) TaxID=1220924 RepID=W2S344_CYPE1|nr:uncharacterized protein HMPREF1541_01603 [Cyphellophora europaea CBS 101466]ETN42448.1 hypothetical protein HMPREF1541_01603 [Cyphellophora europaea CBS 101466]